MNDKTTTKTANVSRVDSQTPCYARLMCKIFGHKFNQVELMIFEIKNNPRNVAKNGYSSLTCPRCKEVFNPGA